MSRSLGTTCRWSAWPRCTCSAGRCQCRLHSKSLSCAHVKSRVVVFGYNAACLRFLHIYILVLCASIRVVGSNSQAYRSIGSPRCMCSSWSRRLTCSRRPPPRWPASGSQPSNSSGRLRAANETRSRSARRRHVNSIRLKYYIRMQVASPSTRLPFDMHV